MNFKKGQGVLGKIRFADGELPQYPRPYLVMNVFQDHIDVLNVSSVRGKEHKLLYPSNEEIIEYNPPFFKPSFVKLDSLVSVPDSYYHNLQILHNGDCLDEAEFNRICDSYYKFIQGN